MGFLNLDDPISNGNPPVNDLKVALSSQGEIMTKGRHVFMGYYNDKDKTEKAFDQEGWFRTGDLGRKLNDASIVIEGKNKLRCLLWVKSTKRVNMVLKLYFQIKLQARNSLKSRFYDIVG